MTKKEQKETSHKCKCNIWMYISIALGLAFIITLVLALVGISNNSKISTNEASNKVLELMKATQPDLDINVVSAIEENGLYKITLSAQGQNVDIFITTDGKYLIPGNAVYPTSDIEKQVTENKDTNTETNYYSLPNYNAPTMGNAESKITVMEFSDYQCPFCGMVFGSPWTEQYKSSQYGSMIGTTKKIEDLAKSGKLLFKQYPVAINTSNNSTESIDASNASLCANDQGKYWEMHDALFNAQDSEKEYTGKYAKDKLKVLAEKIEGLDLTKFNECVDKDTHVQEVKDMTQEVGQIAYSNTNSFGTPTFYIVVDASLGKDKIENLAKSVNYKVQPTQDETKYVIIADPIFANIETVINGLA